MSATEKHILKHIQHLKIQYTGESKSSRRPVKLERIGCKFVVENAELLESISILQKPTQGSFDNSYLDNSDYEVRIDCKDLSMSKALTGAIDQKYVTSIDGKIVALTFSSLEKVNELIQFIKSLNPGILSLTPDETAKMRSTIYSLFNQLDLCNAAMLCLRAGHMDDAIQLNDLISVASYRLTYQIAKAFEESHRTDEAIKYYKAVHLSDSEYASAQDRLSRLMVADTPAAKIECFQYLLRAGENSISRLDKPLLQEILQSVHEEELISIVCNKHNDVDVLMHLAEQFDSLAASSIVDSLCSTLHRVLGERPYLPCVARYNLLLAKRLGTADAIASNPELQARFYNHCLVASLASKKFHANEILIEQMEKDLVAQPVTLFLTNVLKLSQENTAILYHAGMALIKKGRPLLASCLLQHVVQSDSKALYTLAANENMALLSITLANKSDMDRISSCIDKCVKTGNKKLPESIAKAGANFEEKISSPNASSSSSDSAYESRIQALEKQIHVLQSKVESLELQLAMKHNKSERTHRSSKTHSSGTHSIFSDKSSRSHSSRHRKERTTHSTDEVPGKQAGEGPNQVMGY
ncbi:hypothetical protein Lgee_1307 [Legionella geestiana]|uniref:Uncharacterized protein n=1 Tax=Legionella geestiana TaxID=45065 RepID=A0A0W0TTL7_9GAMM|nr:hypothetical protein [Legionella geestiana]KTC99041.1 hypothetical protein Lgee_1307 [Legionella geestiana]QBS12628.1 hypothetical protein E4T54_07665 [Legionella geestiana]QDQ39654.1 hypothetical protein E3226_004185 [Legionella geestiana]STX54914.1 Uncharacterised protein [Legionella geestiana]